MAATTRSALPRERGRTSAHFMDRDLPLSVKLSLGRPWVHALALLASAGCVPDLVGLPCVVDENCPTGQFCDQGQCYPPRNGSTGGGSATDGGEAVDGGVAIDGGSSDDGGSGHDGGSPADGGPLDGGGAVTDAGLTGLDGGEDAGWFPQPPDTIAVNFTVDDTANRVFTAGDGGASSLQWKGTFSYDAGTRELAYDNSWGGPILCSMTTDRGPRAAMSH